MLAATIVLASSPSVRAQRASTAPAAPRIARIDPRPATTANSPQKYEPWIPRLNAAIGAIEAPARRSRGSRGQDGGDRTAVQSARAELEALLEVDADNPVARRFLAEILAGDGEFERARKLLGSTSSRDRRPPPEPVPLVEWQVLGPFANRGGEQSLREVYEPETRLDFQAAYKGDGRICRWKTAKGPRVDYREILGVDGAAVGFAHCEFISEHAGWVAIGFGSADGIKAWLNGNVILVRPVRRDVREDDDIVWAWVRRGRNQLLVKVESDGGSFVHYAQIHDELRPSPADFLDAALAGRKALAAGKHAEAESAFLRADGIEPGNALVAVGLAQAALGKGNAVAARSWATRALALRPGLVDGLAAYSRALLRLDQPLKAFDALRAAYRETGGKDQRIFDLWVASAREENAPLQEGIALLERARGLRLGGKGEEAAAALAQAEPLLADGFVGLAELASYRREGGERPLAAQLELRALESPTDDQVALHCSADWLLELAADLQSSRPQDASARERVLALVQRIDPNHPVYLADLLRSLDGADRPRAAEVMERIERLLEESPTADACKKYVEYLTSQHLDERVVAVCRKALESGVESRTLRLRLGESLIELRRLDDAEEVLRGLLDERDYAERARAGLDRIAGLR